MLRSRPTLPAALAFCLAVPTVSALADPPGNFDGRYRGQMTLQPSGLNSDFTAPACTNQRPARMAVSGVYVFVTYHDWHRHLIHYKGRVNPDGSVKAWHRNRDGTGSILTGNISGNQFTANITRGRCDYTLSLSKV
jgi:hypothetical protein